MLILLLSSLVEVIFSDLWGMVMTTFRLPRKWLLDNYVLHPINLSPSVKALQPVLDEELYWGWENNATVRRARKQLVKCCGEDSVSFPTVLTIVDLKGKTTIEYRLVVHGPTEVMRYTLYRRLGFLSNGSTQWKYSNQFLTQPLSNGLRKIPDGPLRYAYRFLFILSLVVRLIEIWLSYLKQMKKYKVIKM